MARLYLLNLRLNIRIDNDISRGSSKNSTCNIPRRVFIWVEIVTSEVFSLTEMIWFYLIHLDLQLTKSRSQEKHVKLSSKFNSLYLMKWALYFDVVPTIFKASYLFVRSSFFSFSRKVTSKILQLVSCFVKSKFCWQSVEIWLTYHVGSVYAKWLTLRLSFTNFTWPHLWNF